MEFSNSEYIKTNELFTNMACWNAQYPDYDAVMVLYCNVWTNCTSTVAKIIFCGCETVVTLNLSCEIRNLLPLGRYSYKYIVIYVIHIQYECEKSRISFCNLKHLSDFKIFICRQHHHFKGYLLMNWLILCFTHVCLAEL